jgi:hypothetical protein
MRVIAHHSCMATGRMQDTAYNDVQVAQVPAGAGTRQIWVAKGVCFPDKGGRLSKYDRASKFMQDVLN